MNLTFIPGRIDGQGLGPVDGAMANPTGQAGTQKKRGPVRQAGLVILGGLAVWLTVTGTYQVLRQSLWPDPAPTQLSCRLGAEALLTTLETARERASEHTLNEKAALKLFRSDLAPVWDQAQAITLRCEQKQDKVALRALRSLELLRYAEERSIRLSAVDLTQLRRSTPRLVHALATKSQ